MTGRYAVNLPLELKREAEALADEQGISLNQFILWSVAEKVSALKARLDDPRFPGVTYQRGEGGPEPRLRGSNLPVAAVVAASRALGPGVTRLAQELGVSERQVRQALDFAAAHRQEIERLLPSPPGPGPEESQ